MKSIYSFTIPDNYEVELDCKYKENFEVEDFKFNILDFNKYEKFLIIDESKVGTKSGFIVDKNIRNSRRFSCCLSFYPINNSITKYKAENIIKKNIREIQKITPEIYSSIIYTKTFRKRQICECIIYEEGGFFKKHSDTRINKTHFAIMLIFPPINLISNHEGGVLKIWDENGKIFEFHSSLAKEWTFILFHPNLEHECTPITKGKRVIFKKELYYDTEAFRLLNYRKKVNNPILIEVPKVLKKDQDQYDAYRLYRMEIDENLKKMDDIVGSKEELNDEYPHEEIEEICKKMERIFKKMDTIPGNYEDENMLDEHNFSEINKIDNKIIIYVLNRYYPIEEEQCLYEDDLNFFNKIKENYPLTYLRNFKVEMDDDFRNISFHGSKFYFQSETDSKNIKIVYQGGTHIGKFIKTEDVYNDQDYDYQHFYKYTAIIIPKYTSQ